MNASLSKLVGGKEGLIGLAVLAAIIFVVLH